MVICLELGADLHMAQLMPLPLTVSRFSKIQIGFTFLVPAHPGSPGQKAVKRVCVCVYKISTMELSGANFALQVTGPMNARLKLVNHLTRLSSEFFYHLTKPLFLLLSRHSKELSWAAG